MIARNTDQTFLYNDVQTPSPVTYFNNDNDVTACDRHPFRSNYIIWRLRIECAPITMVHVHTRAKLFLEWQVRDIGMVGQLTIPVSTIRP